MPKRHQGVPPDSVQTTLGFGEAGGEFLSSSAAATDEITISRVRFAQERLERSGVLTGAKTHKVSIRLDPGLLAAARARVGDLSDTELVSAALSLLAGQDTFGAWLVTRAPRIPEDFELGF